MLICAPGLPDVYRGLAMDVAILVGAGLLVMGRSVRLGSPVR